jgi:hypothetical protein
MYIPTKYEYLKISTFLVAEWLQITTGNFSMQFEKCTTQLQCCKPFETVLEI